MTNQLPLNVISPKALEKQLKIVEARISVLQAEMSELEKIKNACLVLMGTPEETTDSAANANGRTKKKKSTTDEDSTEIVETAASLEEAPSESLSTH